MLFDELDGLCQNVFMIKDSKRDAILEAASEQFRQYGYRKTSMDDISKRLGISRASLYSYFDNKDDIFRGASNAIHAAALQNAKNQLTDSPNSSNAPSARSLPVRIEQALLARHVPFHNAVIQSPHGGELFDEYSRLCGDIVLDSHKRFQAMLASALRAASQAGEINLKNAGVSAITAAELLNLSAAGLKHGAADSAVFKKRVSSLVKVFVAGIG